MKVLFSLLFLLAVPLARSDFFDDIGDFFTEDIPDFFIEDIPDFIEDAGDEIGDIASGVLSTVGEVVTDVSEQIQTHDITSPGGFFDFVVDSAEAVVGDVAGNIAAGLGYEEDGETIKKYVSESDEMFGLDTVYVGAIDKIADRAEDAMKVIAL